MFITGAGTDVGKTWVTAALIRALISQGRAVEAFKPVVSGFDPSDPEDSDPIALLNALGEPLTPAALDRMSPLRYVAPLSPPLAARREGRVLGAEIVIELCRDRIAKTAKRLLLIEGAGGAMSPLDDTRTMLDLAAALDLPALLVTGSYLGAISHALTANLALQSVGTCVRAIIVSESIEGPLLEETREAIARHCRPTPVVALKRGGGFTSEQIRAALEPGGWLQVGVEPCPPRQARRG